MFIELLARLFGPMVERTSSFPRPEDEVRPHAKAVRALLVSQDPAVLFELNLAAKAAGYDVVEANTGAEAARLAVEDPPELVVTDTELADMPGLDLCHALKSNPGTFQTTTAVLSRLPTSLEELNAGADVYIPASLKGMALVSRLQSLQHSPAVGRRLTQPATQQRQILIGAAAAPDTVPRRIMIEGYPSPPEPPQLPAA